MTGRQSNKPEIIVPQRKHLTIIVTFKKDIITIDSNHVTLMNQLEERADARRNNQETSGESDEFSNFQSPIAPELKVGLRIYMLFNYGDNDQDYDIEMWSQGEIKIASNGAKLPKESGGFHSKGGFLVSHLHLVYHNNYAFSKKFIVGELAQINLN